MLVSHTENDGSSTGLKTNKIKLETAVENQFLFWDKNNK